MKRIIITGPTGSIGIAIINQMIQNNVEVLAICRPNSKRISRIPKHKLVTVFEYDLSRLHEIPISELPECDVFYHLGWSGTFGASRDDMYMQNKNIRYSLDAVQLAERLRCHTFIGAGSQAEYGRVEGTLSNATPTNPENGYGIAKLCAGQMTRVLCEQKGLKHIWFRVLSIYGPYDGANTMVMSTIYKLLNHETPQFTKGEQLWDYLYSEDAGNAFYLAGEKGRHGTVYCLGSGKARKLVEFILEIQAAVGTGAKVDIGARDYAQKQVMCLCADIDNLKKDTGFCPQYTFKEGIEKTVSWCKNQVMESQNEED